MVVLVKLEIFVKIVEIKVEIEIDYICVFLIYSI